MEKVLYLAVHGRYMYGHVAGGASQMLQDSRIQSTRSNRWVRTNEETCETPYFIWFRAVVPGVVSS